MLVAIIPTDQHTRRSDRPIGGRATWGGQSGAVDRRRSRPQCDRVSPSRGAAAPPSSRGLRGGSPPAVAARHGDGRGARLRAPRCAESSVRGGALADRAALAAGAPRQAPSDRRHPGIHIHRSPNADTTTHYGIRVTTPARTLVDLADVLPPKALTRALNEAQVQRLTTPQELTTLLTSNLEDDFTRFLKRHKLPLPERNQIIAGHEVDAVYRDQRTIIELDSPSD